MQDKDPEFYVDKQIHHEFFYVSSHSLKNVLELGRTITTVIMDGEEVVGAFSIKQGMIYPLHRE